MTTWELIGLGPSTWVQPLLMGTRPESYWTMARRSTPSPRLMPSLWTWSSGPWRSWQATRRAVLSRGSEEYAPVLSDTWSSVRKKKGSRVTTKSRLPWWLMIVHTSLGRYLSYLALRHCIGLSNALRNPRWRVPRQSGTMSAWATKYTIDYIPTGQTTNRIDPFWPIPMRTALTLTSWWD